MCEKDDKRMERCKTVLIILNYNDYQTCYRLLEKVSGYCAFDGIVVVDNCSTDDSYDMLKIKETDKVRVIRNKENRGYAAGNNYGIQYALRKYDPEIIYIANPDVLFEEKAILSLNQIFAQNAKAGVVAPLVEQGYNVWNQPGYWGIIEELYLVIFNLHKRLIKQKLLKRKEITEVGVVEGSFLGIRAEAYREIGQFDERTFLYCEENILGFMLKRCGWKTYVDPVIVYQHLHSNSIKKEYRGKRKAFHHFYDSFSVYLLEYLSISSWQYIFFKLCYAIGYLERIIFDFIVEGKNRWKILKS